MGCQNCRESRVEAKASESGGGCIHRVGRGRIEEEWQVQAWWCAEHEAQEEASQGRTQGYCLNIGIINPFTKEPCVFKAKPASKTVRCLPVKKFKLMVN